jgi:hypothetical protein
MADVLFGRHDFDLVDDFPNFLEADDRLLGKLLQIVTGELSLKNEDPAVIPATDQGRSGMEPFPETLLCPLGDVRADNGASRRSGRRGHGGMRPFMESITGPMDRKRTGVVDCPSSSAAAQSA